MTNLVTLASRGRPYEPPRPAPWPDLSKLSHHELWRILWSAQGVHEDLLTAKQRAARAEWASRCEVFEHEHGAGTSAALEDQYAAYVLGREDELAIRGDDIDIARRLFEALPPDARLEALASLTLSERMRLERRT